MHLSFDAQQHRYAVNGRILPSVTQVLESVGIADYSHIPQDPREAALARGRDVHVLTHYDDEGDLDEASVAPNLAGYLAAWRRFRAEHEVGRLPITRLEERLWHRSHWYAGTLDRVFGGRVLVDIKTGMCPWWVRIQTAAYRAILNQDDGAVLERLAVELHKDGTFRPIDCKLTNYRSDLDTFNAALRVHNEKEAQRR